MARYQETNAALDLGMSMAPWIAASYFHGKESQLAKVAAQGIPESRAARVALNIARKKGILRAPAWSAARRAGLTGALTKIGLSRAAGLFFTAVNVSIFAPLIYSGVRGAVNTVRRIGRDAGRLDFGGQYVDTRGAYTERQRALRAITSSRMSTRAAIGNEAILMHR